METCEKEERTDTGITEFREDGALLRIESSAATTVYEYDEAERLTRVRTQDRAGEHVRVHEYGLDGRLARILARPADGPERVVETYEYDAAGCRTKTFHVDPPAANMGFGVEGSDSAYPAPGATAIRTIYNERERPAAMVFSDASGREISHVELSYDENGNLIEEEQIRPIEMLSAEARTGMNEAQMKAMHALFNSMRRTHRYDENGRRVETRTYMGQIGEDRRTRTYNEYGDIVEEISEHESRQYGVDDDGALSVSNEEKTRSESRILYERDARGNWLTKTVEGRGGPDQGFVVSSVDRRVIAYFE